MGVLMRYPLPLIQTNIQLSRVAVEGALSGRREPIDHAAIRDPQTAAALPFDEIVEFVDAVLDARRNRIPPLTRAG